MMRSDPVVFDYEIRSWACLDEQLDSHSLVFTSIIRVMEWKISNWCALPYKLGLAWVSFSLTQPEQQHSQLESLSSMHMQNLRTAFWGPADDRGHHSNHHDIMCTCLQLVFPHQDLGTNVRTWETGNGSLGNVARSYTFLLLLKPCGVVWWWV